MRVSRSAGRWGGGTTSKSPRYFSKANDLTNSQSKESWIELDGTHSDFLDRLCLHPHHSSTLQEQIKKKRNYKSIVFIYLFRVNAYQVWELTTSPSTKMQGNGNHSFISESWFAARSWSGNDIGVSPPPPPSPPPTHTHTHTQPHTHQKRQLKENDKEEMHERKRKLKWILSSLFQKTINWKDLMVAGGTYSIAKGSN